MRLSVKGIYRQVEGELNRLEFAYLIRDVVNLGIGVHCTANGYCQLSLFAHNLDPGSLRLELAAR